jgi:hypothetical protein
MIEKLSADYTGRYKCPATGQRRTGKNTPEGVSSRLSHPEIPRVGQDSVLSARDKPARRRSVAIGDRVSVQVKKNGSRLASLFVC